MYFAKRFALLIGVCACFVLPGTTLAATTTRADSAPTPIPSAPSAPFVTITSDTNHDGVLSASEVAAETTAGIATATVSLDAANLAGSGSASVTVVDNGVSTTLSVASNGTVTGAANGVSGTYGGGKVTVNFANPGDSHSATVSAIQTDQSGASSPSSTTFITQHSNKPPVPVVAITTDANHDGVLNSAEVSAETTAGVAVATVALNAASLNSSGSASINVIDNGVNTFLNIASNGSVTGAANGVSGTYSGGTMTLSFPNPGDGHSATIIATQIDQYGNSSTANTANVTEHISAPPSPVVTISSDANHDGILNANEISAETTAGVAIATVTLNAANLAAAGSAHVTVIDNGISSALNVASDGTVTGAANGVSATYSNGTATVSFANPGDTHSASVAATQTDQYGNSSTSNTASITERISAPPAPVVTITSDTNHDGVLDETEVNAEATAGVAVASVALNAANLVASGSATLIVIDNGVSTVLNIAYNGTVSGAANGVSASYGSGIATINFPNPGNSHTASINAKQTDQYGNTANGNTASITETLPVIAPPTITNAFGAASIALHATTALSFVIVNPNAGKALSGIAFNDALPAGLVIATPNGLSGNTCTMTPTAAAGGSTIGLVNATLTAGGSCTFSLNVNGMTAGTQSNMTDAITSTESGSGSTSNTATLAVVAPPTIAAIFSPATIATGTSTSLMFTLSNPSANSVAESSVAFIDPLPSGLTVADSSAPMCGGTLTTTHANGVIALSGASMQVNSQCQFSVIVTATTEQQFTNTTNAVSSDNGGIGNTATAILTAGTAHLVVSIDDAQAYASYGHVLNYVVTVSNTGPIDASDIGISETLSSAFDAGGVAWTCIVGDNDGTHCTASGSGPLLDSNVVIPASRSLQWMISVPVTQSATDTTADNTVVVIAHSDPTAPHSATDSDLLVILRNGFESANAGAAPAALPATSDETQAFVLPASPDPLRIDQTLLLTLPDTHGDTPVDTLLHGRAVDGAGFRIERLNLGRMWQVRLISIDAAGMEHPSKWLASSTAGQVALELFDSNGTMLLLQTEHGESTTRLSQQTPARYPLETARDVTVTY